jgi:hypothetical protein
VSTSLTHTAAPVGAAPAASEGAAGAPGRAGRRADLLAALGLAVLAVVVAWPFARSGGFFLDDWWLRAEAFYGTGPTRMGFFDMFGGLSAVTGYRPVALPYYAIVYTAIGSSAQAAAAVTVGTDVLLVLAAYLALRAARMPLPGALAAAAALAAMPWASSTRYWLSASATTLAIALALGGLALGALSLRARRRGLALAVASVVALVASVLTYEVTAGLIGCGLAYYAAARGRLTRAVALKWAVDVAAIGGALVAFRLGRRSESAPAAGWDEHAEALVRESASLVRAGAVPDGRWGVVAQVLVAAIGGALVAFRLGRRSESAPAAGWDEHAEALVRESASLVRAGAVPDGRWGVVAQVLVAALAAGLLVRLVARRGAVAADWREGGRRRLASWVAWAVGGGLAGLAGYLLFVPADPWYHPFQPGQGDRVNATAAVGFAVAYGATVMAFATALTLGLRRAAVARVLVATVLAGLLVGALAGQSRRQADAYVATWRQSERVVDGIRAALPGGVRAGDVLLSFGAAGYIGPGFPALAESWDLNGAVRLVFRTGEVRGYPIFEGQEVVCGATAVELPANPSRPPLYGLGTGAPYGRVVFVDAGRRSARRIDSARTCRSALRTFTPGPYFASS